MIYEWNETKRQINIDKHGIDFLDADLVFESSTKITVDVSRPSDREIRYTDFAEVKGYGTQTRLHRTEQGNPLCFLTGRQPQGKEPLR